MQRAQGHGKGGAKKGHARSALISKQKTISGDAPGSRALSRPSGSARRQGATGGAAPAAMRSSVGGGGGADAAVGGGAGLRSVMQVDSLEELISRAKLAEERFERAQAGGPATLVEGGAGKQSRIRTARTLPNPRSNNKAKWGSSSCLFLRLCRVRMCV